MPMYQCKTKPVSVLCESSRCLASVDPSVVLLWHSTPATVYSGNDYSALPDAGNLSGCLSDSANRVINIPC